MQQNNKDLILLRDFGIVKILADPKGNFYVFWDLTPEQQKLYGKKINPFLCWKKHKFCKLNIKRFHLTCFTCKLRLVISAKDPYFYPVSIHQVWQRQDRSPLRKILAKNLLSLAEALS
jgi:hypothetical protein